jgi:hypothetical protein
VGQHEGGQVAAPVFKRIAEQVLPYLDVPRDVPTGRLVRTAYKNRNSSDSAALEDFTPTDFSTQPDQLETAPSSQHSQGAANQTSAVTVAVDAGGDISVANFAGQTMREVTEACLRLGLEPVLIGSGLAVDQSPAAGARVRRGAKITVQFGAPTPKIAKAAQKVRR